MSDQDKNKTENIYEKALAKLGELSLRTKKIMVEYRKNRDAKKIEELKNKIQNNG